MALNTIPNTGLTNQGYPSDRLVTPIIINGDMSIAQRGTSSTGITSSGFRTCDRFRIQMENLGTWTITQDTNTPSNQGFSNSLKLQCTTANASPVSTAELYIYSKIEGQNLQQLNYGESGAKSLTLSFWVKSNKTGTASLNFMQRDNSKKLYTTNYSISSADTWEKKTITISGDTSGLINNDNGSGFEVFWWFNSGSSYQTGTTRNAWSSYTDADVNVSNLGLGGSTSDNISITGIQLEVGEFDSTTIPSFPFESYANNLEKCQRYYFEEGNNAQSFVAGAFNANDSPFRYTFMKPMRAAPSGSIGGSINTDLKLYSAGSDKTLTNVSFAAITTHGARVEISSSGAFTAGQTGHFYLLNNTGKLKFDAEL